MNARRSSRLPAALLAGLLVLALAPLPVAAGTDRATPPSAPLRAAGTDTPATRLRVALGRLLAEHAFLTLESMRAVALRAPDARAARAALDANSADLAGAIRGVYGDAAGRRFGALWADHVEAVLAYAAAVPANDTTAAGRALDALATYRREFSSFLVEAIPDLDPEAEAEALQLHLDQLVAFANADFARAYETQRAAFHHMFMFGDQLAQAIADQFPDRFTGAKVAFSPAAHLRLTLDRLLGEHLVLSAETMRATLLRTPDAASVRGALDANGAELRRAIESIYGADAGDAFGGVWRVHLDAYVRLIEAVRARDAAGREEALAALDGYRLRLGELLASANPNLTADAVAGLLRHHNEALVEIVDAYAAGRHDQAYRSIRAAYLQTFEVGDALAAAIVAQFPDRFADLAGAPATSIAEPAGRADGQAPPAFAALAVLLVGLAILAIRRLAHRPVRRAA